MIIRIPIRHLSFIILCFLFNQSILHASVLANSSSGPVTETELSIWLDDQLDSEYYTENSDYMSTGGLERAISDIVLERELASRADRAGLVDNEIAAAQIVVQKRDILLKLAETTIGKTLSVSQDQILDVYESLKGHYTQPEKYELQLYMLPKAESASSAALSTLESAIRDAENPAQVSGNPAITSGVVVARPGDFPPDVAKHLYLAQDGDVTPVIEQKNAYYMARVIDYQTTRILPLADVEGQLRNDMLRHLFVSRLAEIGQSLQTSYPLSINQEQIRSVAKTTSNPQTALATVAGSTITLQDIIARPSEKLSKDEVKNRVEEIANRLRLVEWAKQQGFMDSEDFKTQFNQKRNKVLTDTLLQTLEYESTPTEAELRSYFAEHRAWFVMGDQRDVTEVFLPLPNPASMTTGTGTYNQSLFKRRRAMEGLRIRLSSGTTTSLALSELDEYGKLVKVTEHGTAEEGPRGRVLDMAVSGLKKGDISEVKETRRGFYVFLVNDVIPGRDLAFEEARPEALKLWQNELREKAKAKFVDEVRSTLNLKIEHEKLPGFKKRYLETFQ